MARWIWMCAGLALAAAQAGIVEETHSKPVLAATVEVAPFADVRQKLTDLGTLVNNPIVSMALAPAIQSTIKEETGELRPVAAIQIRTYVYQPAWQIAVTSEVAYAAEGLVKTEVSYVDPPKAPRPLVRAEITATGLVALDDYLSQFAEADNRELQAMGDEISGLDLWIRLLDENKDPSSDVDLRSYARACLSFDLDKRGLSFDFALEPGPGVKRSPAAGFRLPAGALDGLPDNAPLVLAVNDMLWGMCGDEKTWRTSCESSARFWDGLVRHVLKKPGGRKYAPILEGVSAAITSCLREASFSDPSDWTVCAFAFGPRREPYIVQDGVSSSARQGDAIDVRFLDAVAVAAERQWPGRGLARASSGRLTVDYAAVLDVAAAESGVKGADRELAKAKQRLGAILGSTTGELAILPQAGAAHSFIFGPSGFHRPVSQKPTGEARLAAALPEAVADRPSCLALLSCYALARDYVLPVAVEFAPKGDQTLYRAIVQALPKARQDSAIAGAYWARTDGSHRFLLRITAEELKNYGAVYNVISAAMTAAPKSRKKRFQERDNKRK
jgi:hypothetical protein